MAPKRGGGGHRGRGRGRTSNTDDPSKNDKGKKKREGKEAEKLLQKSLLDMIPKRPMSEDDKKKVRKAAVKTKAGPKDLQTVSPRQRGLLGNFSTWFSVTPGAR